VIDIWFGTPFWDPQTLMGLAPDMDSYSVNRYIFSWTLPYILAWSHSPQTNPLLLFCYPLFFLSFFALCLVFLYYANSEHSDGKRVLCCPTALLQCLKKNQGVHPLCGFFTKAISQTFLNCKYWVVMQRITRRLLLLLPTYSLKCWICIYTLTLCIKCDDDVWLIVWNI
jgi:hypothetical protein